MAGGIMLPVTLATAGSAALLNTWLAARILKIRFGKRIVHGDGGDASLGIRMRAHANYGEYTPIVLILIGGLELTQGTSTPLGIAALAYLLGRVAHAFGMEGPLIGRQIGTVVTLVLTVILGVWAIAVSHLPNG